LHREHGGGNKGVTVLNSTSERSLWYERWTMPPNRTTRTARRVSETVFSVGRAAQHPWANRPPEAVAGPDDDVLGTGAYTAAHRAQAQCSRLRRAPRGHAAMILERTGDLSASDWPPWPWRQHAGQHGCGHRCCGVLFALPRLVLIHVPFQPNRPTRRRPPVRLLLRGPALGLQVVGRRHADAEVLPPSSALRSGKPAARHSLG
jgi:hypothetical protein